MDKVRRFSPYMVAVIQKKAFKPGTYKGQLLSAERLRQFAEGTNKALAAGVPIPGLKKHAKLAADDKETEEFAATDGAGWLKSVEVDEDGSIGWKLDVPKEVAAGIKDGSIRFTSPEFRDNYAAADGRYTGPIIRHVAFTPLPKAHDQGALAVAMSEGVFQFGEDDYEGPPKKDGDGDGKQGEGDPASGGEEKPKNPDIPTTATDKTKLEAIRACLSQMGAELASDWDWANEGGPDQLLASLKTLAKAKAESDAKAEQKPEEPESKDTDPGMPFSEDELAAMPEAKREFIKRSHAQVVQFAEERIASAKEKAIAAVKSAKLFPALKNKLIDLLGVAQFSESGEAPTLTIEKAAALVAESLPADLQFAEEGSEPEHPEGGEKFFKPQGGAETPEEADAIVETMFTRHKKAG